jgi:hypothetical protein
MQLPMSLSKRLKKSFNSIDDDILEETLFMLKEVFHIESEKDLTVRKLPTRRLLWCITELTELEAMQIVQWLSTPMALRKCD